MNIEKIKYYVDGYAKAIQMPEQYIPTVKELMIRIIAKYEKIYPYIDVEDDNYEKYIIKPQNGKYTTEDFLLNRLMRSVLHVGLEGKSNGQYDVENSSINFNLEKIENQLSSTVPTSNPEFEQWNFIAKKKVVMHEFEHALQTSYSNGKMNDELQDTYKKVAQELSQINNGMYKNEIKTDKELFNKKYKDQEKVIHSGVLCYSKDIKERKYNNIKGIVELNEILNETECLEMAGADIQGRKTYSNGTYFNFRNVESYNYAITNYGDLIKNLLGKKVSFICMYIDPSIFYKAFNSRYNKIFEEEFQNEETAVKNMINQLYNIKQTNSFEDHIKLEKVLAKCLEFNFDKSLGKVRESTLRKKIKEFKGLVITNESSPNQIYLEHMNILNSLYRKIINNDSHGER